MKNFSTSLMEDSVFHYFSIDSSQQNEYVFKKRTGLLKREFNDNWVSSAVELNSLDDAISLLPGRHKITIKKNEPQIPGFIPGKMVRRNKTVIEFLKRAGLYEWKLAIRASALNRIIINQKFKSKMNNFSHYSIQLKFKIARDTGLIEIGEGSTESARFNQDGLINRTREIIDNHKNKREVNFNSTKVPVVLNSGDGAIIFHEILGHSLEADHIYRKLSSVTVRDLGSRIISSNVTLFTRDNNDTFFQQIGCDDEGEVPNSNILIDQGVLKNLISDSFYSDLLKLKSSGFSRVQDFSKIPIPRMFGIYLKPGKYNASELIESTDLGIYAKEFGEGKVYFNKDLFYFNIKQASLIEQGKITVPLGSINVSGRITEVLNSVEMVANDFRYDKGISYCYKSGQTVNVRVGQPTVKIRNLIVTKGIND